MELGGIWLAAPADEALRRSFPDPLASDDNWERVSVPGHWRSHPAFGDSDGPILYRRRFVSPPPAHGARAWLTFEGMFYQGDVWLDGSYLGATEGYFAPHTFEVTSHLAGRHEHLLAVELSCQPQPDRRAKRNLTGIFQHWDCIDPDWNPGGIWAPVTVSETGPVRVASLSVTCPDANAERATLVVAADLDAVSALGATVETTVESAGGQRPVVAAHCSEHTLAEGHNRVRWQVTVEQPQLWWPRSLGAQPLHTVSVTVSAGGARSDSRTLTTGLRQVRMRNFIATVNGERLFLKGTNLAPTKRAPAEAGRQDVEKDVALALGASLDLLRVHAHIGRPELYEAADREGLLLWQDLPLQWSYKGVRREAVRQAREAVNLLGHHPSVAIWCAHNEPFALDLEPGKPLGFGATASLVRGQLLPSWNKTVLDRAIKRTLEKADGSRPVVAHAGVWPHPTGGTSSHFYFGWYHGQIRDLVPTLARLPVMARWVGEFGAQAIPESDEFMTPERWPDLDWEHLGRAHCMQKEIFDKRIPASGHDSLASWRSASQRYQAELIRHHVETLRRLKYRPAGGFCQFMFADAQPAITWSVLDHRRIPKEGYAALAAACAEVIVVADRPSESYRPGQRVRLDVHVVSDRRAPIGDAQLSARLRWPGGERTWRFAGEIPADGCALAGRIDHALPEGTGEGEICLDLALEAAGEGQIASNRYGSRVAGGSSA